MTSAGPVHVGWFTFREKFLRLLWMIVRATLFRWSFRRADRWRALLLRCFGARIGRNVLIRSTAVIEIPWNLALGDFSQLGDQAIIYNLGPITIGERTIISQFAHLCGGTHDHSRSDMPLHRVPIQIGSDVWVCTDVYVAPGVVIEDGTVVGARSNVYKDLPAWRICIGSPARPVKHRVYTFAEKHKTQ